MDDIEREVARWDDFQSSVGGEASGPKGLPSPLPETTYLSAPYHGKTL